MERIRATPLPLVYVAHLRTFLLEGESITMQHYIAER